MGTSVQNSLINSNNNFYMTHYLLMELSAELDRATQTLENTNQVQDNDLIQTAVLSQRQELEEAKLHIDGFMTCTVSPGSTGTSSVAGGCWHTLFDCNALSPSREHE